MAAGVGRWAPQQPWEQPWAPQQPWDKPWQQVVALWLCGPWRWVWLVLAAAMGQAMAAAVRAQ